jgi:hypothetical protein
MRNLIWIILFGLITITGFACSKNVSDLAVDEANIPINEALAKANSACESTNPEQSLKWLRDIVIKAEEDKKTSKHMGNYMGKIFSTSYQNKPVFFITMIMGSGGLAYYVFDCDGSKVNIIQGQDEITFSDRAEKGQLIYSNVPI